MRAPRKSFFGGAPCWRLEKQGFSDPGLEEFFVTCSERCCIGEADRSYGNREIRIFREPEIGSIGIENVARL
jgi:hypothetical protein